MCLRSGGVGPFQVPIWLEGYVLPPTTHTATNTCVWQTMVGVEVRRSFRIRGW